MLDLEVKFTSNTDLNLLAAVYDLRSWMMVCLDKLTFNIDLNILAAVFELWSWNMCRGTHIYIYSGHFGVLNVEIG